MKTSRYGFWVKIEKSRRFRCTFEKGFDVTQWSSFEKISIRAEIFDDYWMFGAG